MRSLRLTAVLSAWLCLWGTTNRGVDASPSPQAGTNQHNPNAFTGMNGLIETVLNAYIHLPEGEQQHIAKTLRKALADRYIIYDFATVVYDYNDNIAYTNNNVAYEILYPGARSGAITAPQGCDQAGMDPPWDACWEGGSLRRLFAGSRAVDEQGQPTLVRTAVVFWWPAIKATHEEGTPAQIAEAEAQKVKIAWWERIEKNSDLWRSCANGETTPVDVTVMALCFTEAYAEYVEYFHSRLTHLWGFLVAPAQAEYDFSSGHIFTLVKAIRFKLPHGQMSSNNRAQISVKLLFAALI